MVHANQLNNESWGIEIENPYAPSLMRNEADEFRQIRPADWWTWCPDKQDRRYVCPTTAQIRTLTVLVPWLCRLTEVPYEFPTWHLSKVQRKIKGWKTGGKPAPGIVAHRDFSKHADGRWPLESLIASKLLQQVVR